LKAPLVAIVAWLLLAAPAAAAVRPADGQWQANGSLEVVYFTVTHHGTQITETDGLIGDPISCGWSGGWTDTPIVPISGGSFTAHDTGAAETDPDQLSVTGTFASRSAATLTFTITCTRSTGVITQTRTFSASTNAPPPKHCATARVTGGTLQLGGSAIAHAHPNRFRHRAAVRIHHRKADCAEVERVMDSVLRARDESKALASVGYVVSSVRRIRFRGRRAYRVTARQGLGVGAGAGASIAYVRAGSLRIDHSIYRPGQWIDIPEGNGYEVCTASWVLEPRTGPPLVATTAGHCAPVFAPIYREVAGHARVIGSMVGRDLGGLDAGVFTLDPPSGWAQQVERGGRVPLTAVGWVPTRDQHKGDRVCFAGRVTGADQCGKLVDRYSLVPRNENCTNIDAHKGDSGGPVYTQTSGGTTRAVGIVAKVVSRALGKRGKMCYVPIESILKAFQANFA
jgi:hypothetical protein